MSKNTILITGGLGYIGSHTIIELAKNPLFEIISIDNFCNSSEQTINRIEDITQKKIKNYTIDLCDKTALEQVFIENTSIIGIIHFAALKAVGESVQNPLLYYHNNINSLVNILFFVKKHKIPNFIFSSSCTVYGNIHSLPVNEQSPIQKAESPYGQTKVIGEQIIIDFLKTCTTKAIILRYFNPVGAHISGKIGEDPRNKPNNLVPIITQTAIGKLKQVTVFGNDYKTRDGTCIRDYVHVSDIADAHLKALNYLINNSEAPSFDVFNLGTGSGISVLEVIKAFEKISGQNLNYTIGSRREGDVAAIYSDSTRAHTVLKWNPQYNLQQMMDTAWKWELNQQSTITTLNKN